MQLTNAINGLKGFIYDDNDNLATVTEAGVTTTYTNVVRRKGGRLLF